MPRKNLNRRFIEGIWITLPYFLHHLNLPTSFENIYLLNTRTTISASSTRNFVNFRFQISKFIVITINLLLQFTES